MKKLLTAKDCQLFLIGIGYGNGDGNGDGDYFALPHPYYKVDGIWCKFIQIHGNYAKVKIMDMYNVDNCKPAYIAKDGYGNFAHGTGFQDAMKWLPIDIKDLCRLNYLKWKNNS